MTKSEMLLHPYSRLLNSTLSWPNRNFDFVMAESKGSLQRIQKLSNSALLWKNQRCRSGWVDDCPTRLHQGRIKTSTLSYSNQRGCYSLVENFATRLRHGRIEDIVAAISKTFLLGFIVWIETLTSSWLNWGDITTQWMTFWFGFTMAE